MRAVVAMGSVIIHLKSMESVQIVEWKLLTVKLPMGVFIRPVPVRLAVLLPVINPVKKKKFKNLLTEVKRLSII